MNPRDYKLMALTMVVVLLTVAVLYWRYGRGDHTASGDWQPTSDSQRLQMELGDWISGLQKLSGRELSDAISRRFDVSIQPAERPAMVRQTVMLLRRLQSPEPREVVRYRQGDIVRATWTARDGSDVILLFRSRPGDLPRLLRTATM